MNGPDPTNFRWTAPPREDTGTLLLAPKKSSWGTPAPLWGRARCSHHIRLYKGNFPYSLFAWFCPSPRYLIVSCCPVATTSSGTPDAPATMDRHRTLFTQFDESPTTEFLGSVLAGDQTAFSVHHGQRGPCHINFGLPPDILAAPVARGACLPLIPGRYPYVFRDVRLVGVQAWIALPPFPTP